MKTAMQGLLLKLATQTEKDSFGRRIIQLSIVDKEIVEALEKEKEQYLDLIRFMRTNDKMGKTVEDLYNEFLNQNK